VFNACLQLLSQFLEIDIHDDDDHPTDISLSFFILSVSFGVKLSNESLQRGEANAPLLGE